MSQMNNFADDPGVGWHLKTGEFVWISTSAPRFDPFLASESRPWVADQWLSDLLLFSVYRAGSWRALYVGLAGVWLVTFFGVLHRAVRVQIGSSLASVVAVLLAFKCAQVHFILRPIIFSIFLFTCTLVTARKLSRLDSLPAGSLVLPGSFLIALFVLWSNIHPAFVLGLILVFCLPISRILDGKRSGSEVAKLALLAVLCLLGTFVNPYGVELHRSIIALGRSSYFLSLNREWLPTDLASFEGLTLIVLVVTALIAALVSRCFRASIGWFDILVSGFLALQAFYSVRFLPFAAIALTFTFAAALRCMAQSVVGIRWLGVTVRYIRALENYEGKSSTAGIFACVCALVGVFCYRIMPLPEQLGPQEASYPRAILESIRTDAPGGVILASPDFGGFITANLYPAFKAVIDDRNTLIGEQLYRDFFQSLKSPETLSVLVNRFQVTHLIIPRNSPTGANLASSPNWPVLLDDGRIIVVKVARL
jgi:hypothetical protein